MVSKEKSTRVLVGLVTLRAKLRNVLQSPLSVCVFICLFVGPPYYSQRVVFASPLSAFSFLHVFILCVYLSYPYYYYYYY